MMESIVSDNTFPEIVAQTVPLVEVVDFSTQSSSNQSVVGGTLPQQGTQMTTNRNGSTNPDYSSEEEEFDTKSEVYKKMTTSIVEENGRNYQIALTEMAKNSNIIVCLPTGSGKTYIALQLTKFYLATAIKENKKIVFLANTVPLVHQQAGYFRNHLFLTYNRTDKDQCHVQEVTGDMNVDIWDKDQWDIVMKGSHVFVMTSQVLLDALGRSYIQFKKLCLLILDECHHADKDHPMNRIMEKYADIKDDPGQPDYPLPRVLGLTATIIKGNAKIAKIKEEVHDIEGRLRCRAMTYHDYEEVLRHSTSAEIIVRIYQETSAEYKAGIMQCIENTIDSIKVHGKYAEEPIAGDQIDHPSYKSPTQLYNRKKSKVKEYIASLNDVRKMFEDDGLGLYPGRLAAILKIAYLQMMGGQTELLDLLRIGATTTLSRLICFVDDVMAGIDRAHQVQRFVSEKVKLLFLILLEWKRDNPDEELCGIVFCKERLSCQILTWLFMDAKEHCGDKFKFITPAFVVGSSRDNNDIEEQRITSKKQEEVILKFHNKTVNLIFATNVLEEGLNVPCCNVVIRFDSIDTYPSYIQSMGRARKRNALFSVLSSKENEAKIKISLENFASYNEGLAAHLKDHALHLDMDEVDHEPEVKRNNEDKLAVNPADPDGPVVTLTEAVQLVHTYCNLLSCDRFVILSPYSWWEETYTVDNVRGYKAYVQLPSNSCVRGVVEGTVKETKNDAKRAAFLEVCRILYEKGALDKNLLPLPRSIPPKIVTYLDEVEGVKERVGKKVGTKQSTQWYPKMVPESILSSDVKSPQPFSPYLIKLSMAEPDCCEEILNLYKFTDRSHAFGVISPINFGDIPPIPLHGSDGVLQSQFIPININLPTTFDVDTISRMKMFQDFIFGKLLKMKHELAVDSGENPFFIVPLVRECNKHIWNINWQLCQDLEVLDDLLFHQVMNETERRARCWTCDELGDGVIVPWYREVNELLLYCVTSIAEGVNANSPIDESSQRSKSFKDYYADKYGLVIMNEDQPFAKCKLMPKQLNFISKKKNLAKMTKEERKANKESSSVVIMIPEFTKKYPIPASLLVQSRFLPSIIHRAYRLMLSMQLKNEVAGAFQWERALKQNWSDECRYVDGVLHDDEDNHVNGILYVDENHMDKDGTIRAVTSPNRPSKRPIPTPRKFSRKPGNSPEKTVDEIRMEIIEQVSLANFGKLSLRENIGAIEENGNNSCPAEIVKTEKPNKPQRKKSICEKVHVDYVHPDKISSKTMEDMSKWKRRDVKETENILSSASPSTSSPSSLNKTPMEEEEMVEDYALIPIDSIHFPSLDASTNFETTPGPSPYAIMQAITLSNANDILSLEMLEAMGDSFLKFCASRHIFTEFPKGDEGVLTKLRNRLVSNAYLYSHGKDKKLGEFLSGGIFCPEYTWLPPSKAAISVASLAAVECDVNMDMVPYNKEQLEGKSKEDVIEAIKAKKFESQGSDVTTKTPGHTTFTHTRLGDKSIADCVEALIGAYFVHGGQDSAMRFMDWLGLRPPNAEGVSMKYGRCNVPAHDIQPHSGQKKPEDFLPMITELEDLIGYKFTDKWYLVEAFSHPGYLLNTITDCYQRLEFLGDAVLDFLVTDHIFKNKLASTPGEVTDLRSALVNNVTFGSLVVRYGFHKYLLLISKQLQDVVDTFVSYQEENGHSVTGHFKLLNDLECPVAADIEVPKVLGDIFESLAGAVYLDSGMSLDTTWKVFYRLMKNEIDEFSQNVPKSPIRELYEKFPGLVFKVRNEHEEESGKPTFAWVMVQVRVQGKLYLGCGMSQRQAKQAAAKYILRCLTSDKSCHITNHSAHNGH